MPLLLLRLLPRLRRSPPRARDAALFRRLAKLEMEKASASPITSAVYGQFFGFVGHFFDETINNVTKQVESAWNGYKTAIARQIPPLARYADEQSQRLSLPNSGQHLRNLLYPPPAVRKGPSATTLPTAMDSTIAQVQLFANRYKKIADLEMSSTDLWVPGE